jgi:hypothetical protein
MARSKIRQQIKLGSDGTNSLALIPPQENDGTAITGIGVDRLGADTGLFIFDAAAASGSPTAATTAIKIQDCDTLGGTYADFLVLETALDIDAAAKHKAYLVNLEGAKRYVNMVVDTTYTAGTSPANVLAANVVLGDYDIDPPVSQSVLGD